MYTEVTVGEGIHWTTSLSSPAECQGADTVITTTLSVASIAVNLFTIASDVKLDLTIQVLSQGLAHPFAIAFISFMRSL